MMFLRRKKPIAVSARHLPVVIYDANCQLCESIKNGLSHWGRKREIRFLHFQDPHACNLQPDLYDIDYLDAIRFIDGSGKSWKGADAVRHLLKMMPFGLPLAWILSLPGMYYLAEKVYIWVARNRYWLFGRTV
jgi:predicted DCC family thiol-disulfide oxidoreductase YuxK